jgi:hypothetical protein
MDPEWLTEARRRFGDRKEVFDYVETPYSIWANLRDVFSAAYTYPYNEADIRAIYEYAEWSCKQPRGESAADDLLTVVAVGFYEHVPQVAAAVKDLPRWFKLDEILTMREILSYHVGDDGFEQLLQAYPKTRQTKKKRKS